MKKLVIFGCGYVGGALARQAVKLGYRVSVLSRNGETLAALRDAGVAETVMADLHSEDWHEQLSGDFDVLVNCVSSAGGGIEGYRLSYVMGQQSILAWAGQRQVGTYVYTSSTSVYPQSGGANVTEAVSNEGVSEGAALLLQSEALLESLPESVSRYFVLRLTGIYGPGRHYMLNALREGTTVFPGKGDFWLNLIHRDDICAAIWAVIDANATIGNRIYNVSDGHPAMKEEVVQWLAQQLDVAEVRFDENAVGPGKRMSRKAGPPLHRRIANEKICQELEWAPMYGDYQAGYGSILG